MIPRREQDMTGTRLLQGLMKWLTREEWRDRFAEVYDDHLLPACDQTDLDVEEIISILGEDWFMSTVWGCAFEDFLTRDFEDGSNIVDDYLKRRGWKEGASTRAYMAALRTSVMSLYEVSDIVRDTSFRARDLVRGGEPILISERSATRSLKPWDRIATRVVQVGSQTQISGAVLLFDRDTSEELLKLLRKIAKRAEKEKQAFADLVGRRVDNPAIANGFSETAVLHAVTPTITAVWLIDTIDRALGSQIPEVCNAEGDELLLCTAYYPFMAGTRTDDIRSALGRCPELRQENATIWNWISSGKPTKTLGMEKHPPKSQIFITSLGDGSLVLGGVELKDRALVLSVNSRERSDRGRALLSKTLGGLVGQPLVEMQSIDQLMASQNAPVPSKLDMSEEERSAIIHDSLDRHYRHLLDQPIPMLGNKSPRAAVRTAKGRIKVVDWLKTLENHAAKSPGRSAEIANYSFSWLWAELGVAELKR
jgi:hypothetical protein